MRNSFASAQLFLMAWCWTGLWWLASPAHGAESNPPAKHPRGEYLPAEKAEVLSKELHTIKVHDCTEREMTLEGLVAVLNRHILAAHRSERISWPDRPHWSLEQLIRMGNLGLVYGEAKGRLNHAKLLEQINQGSVGDLLDNLTLWLGASAGCYDSGIYIGLGENWPRDAETMSKYKVIFE